MSWATHVLQWWLTEGGNTARWSNPITREGPVVADFYTVDFVLVPHLAKPGRDVGIIDAVSRADGEEAAVGPFSIWGLVGVLLLEVCDALFREEILLQNIDNRVSRLAYEERRRGEVGRGPHTGILTHKAIIPRTICFLSIF